MRETRNKLHGLDELPTTEVYVYAPVIALKVQDLVPRRCLLADIREFELPHLTILPLDLKDLHEAQVDPFVRDCAIDELRLTAGQEASSGDGHADLSGGNEHQLRGRCVQFAVSDREWLTFSRPTIRDSSLSGTRPSTCTAGP